MVTSMSNNILTVLLVDDELPILDRLKKMPWEEHGYKIIGECRNGIDALDFYRSSKPHIIITDITMPRLDGIELSKILKEENAEIEIILLTCHSEFEYAKSALIIGVRDYLVKGIYRVEDLFAALGRCRSNILTSKINSENHNTDTMKRFEIKKALEYINCNLDKHIYLNEVADSVELSCNYLGKIFKEEMGEKFSDYITKKRMEKAAHLLISTNEMIYEIAEACGYSNYRYFIQVFIKQYNKTPSQYRRGM